MPAQDIKFIDLFAGIGGFRYGLENANITTFGGSEETPQGASEVDWKRPHSVLEEGVDTSRGRDSGDVNDQPSQRKFNCVYTNEWDKYASQIYEHNFKQQVDSRDIRTIDTSEIPDHDLLCGGFPCQAFSIAGKRAGFNDTRGTLFFEIARILKDKRPRYLLLENVKGLLSHDSGKTFSTILGVLADLGYECQWQVLNSKNFGVPQNRERIYIIGHLREASRPEVFPIRGDAQVGGWANASQTANTLTANYWKGPAASRPLVYVGGVLSKKKWLEDGKTYSRNFSQGQRIYSTEGISATLAGNAGGLGGKTGLYESGRNVRRLTPVECERLQGFPDNWTQGISDTQRYKCLGNAVTTNVVAWLGSQLIKYI